MKKLLNFLSYFSLFSIIILLWQFVCYKGLVPNFILPSPMEIAKAFIDNFQIIIKNSRVSLLEALIGLSVSIILSFFVSILMDRFKTLYKSIYPILIITQTIPVIAIAPLLVLWMGYGILPKITLIVLVCFFPIAVSMLERIQNSR